MLTKNATIEFSQSCVQFNLSDEGELLAIFLTLLLKGCKSKVSLVGLAP